MSHKQDPRKASSQEKKRSVRRSARAPPRISIRGDTPWLGSAPFKVDLKEQPSTVSASTAMAMFSPTAVAEFRLTTVTTVTATAGGGIASVFTCDPSSFAEYSDILALFGEIRLKSTSIHIGDTGKIPVGGSNATGTIPVAFDVSNTSTAPANTGEVWSVPGARIKQIVFTPGSNGVFSMTAKIPPLEWALTSAPVPGPYAGCYGAWVMYRSALIANAYYFDVWIENVYEVRARH